MTGTLSAMMLVQFGIQKQGSRPLKTLKRSRAGRLLKSMKPTTAMSAEAVEIMITTREPNRLRELPPGYRAECPGEARHR